MGDCVRLRKSAGGDCHRSALYAMCRKFPGPAEAVTHLVEVCRLVLRFTSSGPGRDTSKPEVPSCLPTPPNVLVKHVCAFMEALSRDAKPIWAKQYIALRQHLLTLRNDA